jgi:lipopolysaccharide transport system permease protein
VTAGGAAAPASSLPSLPVRVYRKRRGWIPLDWRELWEFRELLFFLTWRDVMVRYKQTALGAAWAVLQPALTMVIFTLIFGRLAKLPSDGFPYPIFVYAALLPWTFFANAVTTSSNSLVNSANLITKVYFPRVIVPLASVCAGLVDFACAFVLLAVLLVWYHVPLTPMFALMPLMLLGTVIAAVAVGTILSALTVTYRDFRYVVPFAVQLWLYATPVMYATRAVPERWRLWYALNPMAGMTEGFRSAILGRTPLWPVVGVSAVTAALALVVGVAYFQRVERRFVDIV